MHPDIIYKLRLGLERREQLTDWEQGFMKSLNDHYDKHKHLSDRQVEILDKVYRESLSDSAVSAASRWEKEYDAEKRRIANVCAKYYKANGYFTELAFDILNTPDFIPTEKQWKKMCCNKYAAKVLFEFDKEPSFADGSLVELRSTAPWSIKASAKGMPCVVISSGGDILRAAKGSKPYRVLPFGSAAVIECEERDLKACKNPKKRKKYIDNSVPF
tara:strand:+ start:641 stop:1288 length:648 start_codon:yes stop_codon:yes gene_type:complete